VRRALVGDDVRRRQPCFRSWLITDTAHRFANGDRVTVLLTSHTSTVDGTVVDDGDAAVTDCKA